MSLFHAVKELGLTVEEVDKFFVKSPVAGGVIAESVAEETSTEVVPESTSAVETTPQAPESTAAELAAAPEVSTE